MNCPVCKHILAHHTLLKSDLPAYQCDNCGGIWISAQEYLRWLKTQPAPLLTKPIDDLAHTPMLDTSHAKLCPTCGHFLVRYRVLPNVEFYVDRCGNCNGVWLDKGEWQILIDHNLHDKINQFFTQPWQAKIRAEEAHAMLDKLYKEKFKPEDYTKLQEVRDWLKDHPQRSMLLAYLQSNDPYKI